MVLPALRKNKKAGVYHHEADEQFFDEVSDLIFDFPLLEHLDFVFVDFLPKMTLQELIHVMYIFTRCNYRGSLLIDKFSSRYFEFLRDSQNRALVDDKKTLLKLTWVACKSQAF